MLDYLIATLRYDHKMYSIRKRRKTAILQKMLINPKIDKGVI